VSGGGPAAGPEPDTRRPTAARRSRRSSASERAAILAAYARWRGDQASFCERHGLSVASLGKWRAAAKARGEAVAPAHLSRAARRGAGRAVSRRSSEPERRAVVQAYAQGGVSQGLLARLWGVSRRSVSSWLSRFREAGPEGLVARRPGRPRGAAKAVPAALQEAIVQTATAHPDYGVRRLRSHLLRFGGLSASVTAVSRVLAEHGVVRAAPPGRRRAPSLPRRFERSTPNQLWQTDITPLWLGRASRHCQLVVFLDDHSRYVVSWALGWRATADLVVQALTDGIARFGKPEEILTDQGRQYYAWRGKSLFERRLVREGIVHVVSRAHHPETLGKCERLWKTVKAELWSRIVPRDLDEAKDRLAHWIAHYNHQRCHQGLSDGVPADRFFSADSAVRAQIERAHKANELRLALGERPRKPVWLVGQIDGQAVSVHGERGRLVVVTPTGGRQVIEAEDLGVSRGEEPQKESSDEAARAGVESGGRGAGDASAGGVGGLEQPAGQAAAGADGQEAHALRRAGADADPGAGPVGGGDGGGAELGAPGGDGAARGVAGQAQPGVGGDRAGDEPGAPVAAVPAGPVGDAGGRAAAAAVQEPASGAGAAGQPPGTGRGEPEGGAGRDAEAAAAGRGAQPPAAATAGSP
jgi:transposase InsO family protein